MCDNSKDFLKPSNSWEPPQNKRLKLWETPAHWHCCIIGTCFTHDELIKIAKKCGYDIPTGPGSTYKLHSLMVAQADHLQGAARLLHKALERKYKRTLKTFEGADTQETLSALWEQAKEEQNVAAALWALMTHPNSSNELKSLVFGDVHMMSHLSSHTQNCQALDLKKARQNEARFEKDLRETRRRILEIQQESTAQIQAMQKQLSEKIQEAERAHELEMRLFALEDGQIVTQLEQRIEILSKRVVQESERVQFYKDKQADFKETIGDLKNQLNQKQEELINIETELMQKFQSAVTCSEGQSSCQGDENCVGNGDLCGRCIAYIGGQTKLAAFFRDHVEEKNGAFLHHDGGLHDGQAKLLNIIQQADAVMFPVTCISHEASREIKQACIQNQKPFIPLRSKGLGAFRRGLESLEGEFFNKMMAAE